jgi:hypothetical protein
MWADYSERRVKKNIEDYSSGLDEICKLKPRRYQFNDEGPGIDDGRSYIGLIADEVEDIFPEIVSQREEILVKTIDATAVVYALVNAVRTLADKVKQLEGRA